MAELIAPQPVGVHAALIVAVQLPPAAADSIRSAIDGIEVRSIGSDFAEPLGLDVDVLIAVPRYGNKVPTSKPPDGWPYRLRWIHLLSSGTDGYPDWLLEFPRLTTSRGSNAVAVAEFAFAAILAHAKDIPSIWVDRRDAWTPRRLRKLEKATLGIVGLGAIGTAIAIRARAFGMSVQATRASDQAMPTGIARARSLEDLFETSDHVVLALPLNASTKGMVDRRILGLAKPGLHLVNIARGDLIDEAALIEALEQGRLSRATLDVAAEEPPPGGHPFYVHDRIRLSPHLAGLTDGWLPDLIQAFASELYRFLTMYPAAQ